MAIYKPEELRLIFRNKFDKSQWTKILHEIFNATELRATPELITDVDSTDIGYYLGRLSTPDHYEIGFFHYEIKAGSVANKRVGLRNLIKPFLKYEFDAALVVFDSGDHWRLSFICDIKEEATSPKRYTYVFGDNELLYRTPIERFNLLQKKGISFESLKNAFSVEALSNEFFDRYREQYADFIQYVTGKRVVKSGSKWVEREVSAPNVAFMQAFDNNEKRIRDYIKKMMGRITFLHFLQRKGWMNGDLNYMQNMFEQSRHKDNYLDAVLEPLFFGILNTKPSQRESVFEQLGWDKSLLNKWADIPYLNGGLFERDAEDEPDSVFPAEYFARLFQFFSEYNFTIDENDPNDAEVGVDPEMLGKIFENLLEDNKDKGAFYTPKEIVRYMCQESLITYLETNTSIAADKIRQFVLSPEEGAENIPEMKRPKLVKALEDVKICDPAIGSGAFPMGLLNELLRCREALSGEHYDRAEIKKSIIQNCIYGVDIERGAVDIARLRFWLSIVVDEEKPLPLPNLDYKIMQGNSLIESFMGMDLSELTYKRQSKRDCGAGSLFDDEKNRLQKVVSDLLREYYSCSDHDSKIMLQQRITDTINAQLEAQNYDPEILQQLRKINLAENNKFFLWHTWFSDVFNREDGKNGFDIVIGNPPYVDYRKINEEVKVGISNYHTYKLEKKGSLYVYFIEKGLHICNPNYGILVYINPYQYLSAESGFGIRDFIMNSHYLKSIVDVSNIKVFDMASTYTCINTLLCNCKQEDIYVYRPKDLKQINCNQSILKASSISKQNKYEIIISNNEIIAKIEQFKSTLSDFCNLFCGLSKTGFRDYVTHSKINDDYLPFVESKQIERYITKTNKYIDTNLYSIQTKKRFNKECLFMCRMTSKMRVGLSYANETGGKINVLHNFKDEKSKLYILGLLNSRLLNYYYCTKNETKHLNGGALPFDTESVKIIPIANASIERQIEIAELVSEIVITKRNGTYIDDIIERKIDNLVYEIYGLTDEEIKIIEQSI